MSAKSGSGVGEDNVDNTVPEIQSSPMDFQKFLEALEQQNNLQRQAIEESRRKDEERLRANEEKTQRLEALLEKVLGKAANVSINKDVHTSEKDDAHRASTSHFEANTMPCEQVNQTSTGEVPSVPPQSQPPSLAAESIPASIQPVVEVNDQRVYSTPAPPCPQSPYQQSMLPGVNAINYQAGSYPANP